MQNLSLLGMLSNYSAKYVVLPEDYKFENETEVYQLLKKYQM